MATVQFLFIFKETTGKATSWRYYDLAERQNIHSRILKEKYLWDLDYSVHTQEQNFSFLSSVRFCGVTWHLAMFFSFSREWLALPSVWYWIFIYTVFVWEEEYNGFPCNLPGFFWIKDFLIGEGERNCLF